MDPPRGSQAERPLSSANCAGEEIAAGILRRGTTSFTTIFLLGNKVIPFMTLILQYIFRTMMVDTGRPAILAAIGAAGGR
ncbi:hypothetical protein [Sphingomonas sp. Root1294]|uniref:hypothetical protein n=1 Tax=Sphingomonas sp. Root1294 TaxID=1736447 RepID=UPI000A533C9A|nr:hypothetical protein [Sphingomonas sp. Root1294]